MDKFWELIFGSNPWYWYAAAYVFALSGLFIRWAIKTNNGIKNNLDTPDWFDWKYWVKHNLVRSLKSIFVTIIVVFLCLRFASEWFGVVPSMVFAAGIGLAFDWFLNVIKKKVASPVADDDEHLMK